MINEGKPVVWLFLYIRYLHSHRQKDSSRPFQIIICGKWAKEKRRPLLTQRPVLRGLLLPTASYYLPKSRRLQSNCREKENRGKRGRAVRRQSRGERHEATHDRYADGCLSLPAWPLDRASRARTPLVPPRGPGTTAGGEGGTSGHRAVGFYRPCSSFTAQLLHW